MLTFTSDIEIDRIGRGVLERTLPKAEWTHAAHFAAAFWLIRRHDGLPRNHHHGVPAGRPGLVAVPVRLTPVRVLERADGIGVRAVELAAGLLVETAAVFGRRPP